MYRNHRIAVVVPAHNEEHQIENVLRTMPAIVDRIIVVDDKSSDGTVSILHELQKSYGDRLTVVCHEKNWGVGAAIGTGYKRVLEDGFDVAIVMAGDGQMDPANLPDILDPVVQGVADYSKGNRLFSGNVWRVIPTTRLIGNSILSLGTKITSGYWHIVDSQSGYTAIDRRSLEMLDIDAIYPRYGMPNDLLVRLNVLDLRVINVPIRPVYNIGEKSGLKISKAIFTISWLLFRMFFWRLKEKYILRDFHPLVLFYSLSFLLIPPGMLLGFILLYYNTPFFGESGSRLEVGWIILCALLVISGLQSLFFAMWFDNDYNRHLCVFTSPATKKSKHNETVSPSIDSENK